MQKNTQSDDLFAVVDENDNVISSARRTYVHANKLLHRAVHALLFNSKGELLMQMRSANKDKYPHCYTTSCSGHVDFGEDYSDALPREMQEELGISTSLEDYTYLGKIDANEETEQEFTKVYVIIYDGDFNFSKEEVDALDWYKKDLLEEKIDKNPEKFTKSFVYIYKYFLSACKNDKKLRIMLAEFLK